MKTRILPIVIAATCWACLAEARPDPTPPPSGIVIHLFGPDSITSNLLPSGGTETTAQGSKTEGTQGSAPAGSAQGTGPATQSTGPSMHSILHEMFVTGDPNMTPGQALSKGRTGGQ